MDDIEQRLVFIEHAADKVNWKELNSYGLFLEQGWQIKQCSIAGAGQERYRSFGIVVLLERPRRKAKEDQ